MRRIDRIRWTALLAVTALALPACTTPNAPEPTPTPGSTPRPFTVMSTQRVLTTDPAAITDLGSMTIAINVFQRLMTAEPGQSTIKGDAARDCRFTSTATLTCTLNKDLKFSNGHALTSSDVKFSIDRALRLNVAGSSTSGLSSLRRIETPDDANVEFILRQPDTQFVWALASPAASILDEETYDPDQISGPDDPIVGSGPFTIAGVRENEFQFARNRDYSGRTPASIDGLVYRSMPDSASIEDAMTKGKVDVVWRGLDTAAVTRVSTQMQQSTDGQTASGFTAQVLPGTRVLQMQWSATSSMRSNQDLRKAVALALQGDRTLDSVVPVGVPGHAASFPLGGRVKPKVTWKDRINLTLSYDPGAPNGRDEATQVRTRLEDTGGLSVRVRPADQGADLQLVDRLAWTPTALAWLQPYLSAPLPVSEESVSRTETKFRTTTDDSAATALLASLQKYAALDQLVLPISQSDALAYTRAGSTISATSYGPGWQLGLFGISRG